MGRDQGQNKFAYLSGDGSRRTATVGRHREPKRTNTWHMSELFVTADS